MEKSHSSFLITILFLILIAKTIADPDPLQDYCIAESSSSQTFFINGSPCINPTLATSAHFATSALSTTGNTGGNPFGFNISTTNIHNMPGINTQGLTMGRIDMAPAGLVPMHWHPRASEVVHVIDGDILVGFADTSNQVFSQQLGSGDSFVFPRATVHFLLNLDSFRPALVVSGLNSQNPGAEVVATSSFASKLALPDEVLHKSFRINEQEALRIRKNLGG